MIHVKINMEWNELWMSPWNELWMSQSLIINGQGFFCPFSMKKVQVVLFQMLKIILYE